MNSFDPYNFDKNIYLDALKEKNLNSLKNFGENLNNLLGNDDFIKENRKDFLLSTTGSDGRLSNLISDKEVIFYHNGLSEDFTRYLQDKVLSIGGVNAFEEKNFGSENILNRETNLSKTEAIWPSVLIDSYSLFGNFDIKKKVDSVLYGKVQKNRKVFHDSKKKIETFRKLTNTGKNILRGNEVTHFDRESGVSFYNPEVFSYGFKMGPVRLVQMKMISEIISYLRKSSEDDGLSFLENLPNDNKSRILFFKEMGISNLSDSEISELIEFFSMFMLLSHKAQYNFKINNVIETVFDKNEVNDALNSLVKITEKNFIK